MTALHANHNTKYNCCAVVEFLWSVIVLVPYHNRILVISNWLFVLFSSIIIVPYHYHLVVSIINQAVLSPALSYGTSPINGPWLPCCMIARNCIPLGVSIKISAGSTSCNFYYVFCKLATGCEVTIVNSLAAVQYKSNYTRVCMMLILSKGSSAILFRVRWEIVRGTKDNLSNNVCLGKCKESILKLGCIGKINPSLYKLMENPAALPHIYHPSALIASYLFKVPPVLQCLQIPCREQIHDSGDKWDTVVSGHQHGYSIICRARNYFSVWIDGWGVRK